MRNVKSVSMQVSGFTLVFDVRRAAGSRLVSALLDCGDCPGGREPLRQGRTYRVVMTEYLAGGGDSFSMIAQNKVDSTASSGGSHHMIAYLCFVCKLASVCCCAGAPAAGPPGHGHPAGLHGGAVPAHYPAAGQNHHPNSGRRTRHRRHRHRCAYSVARSLNYQLFNQLLNLTPHSIIS